MNLPNSKTVKIAVIGLGYVGLPLAVEFAKQKTCVKTGEKLNRDVIGFDINIKRLNELRDGFDLTNEISQEEFSKLTNLYFTNSEKELVDSDVFIITVPTPINSSNIPNLKPLKEASKTIGNILKMKRKLNKGFNSVVVYESTVYPGATEEICIPIIEQISGLKINEDFYCGYSPERINPGDKEKKLPYITKITSGSNKVSAEWIDSLYGSIIKSGTHLVEKIKIAEAAKVIENTQRDLNIALINELTMIFKLLEIDTLEVLKAAETKWNFIPFKPGLVGGHCIGVDPYYLTYKAEQMGFQPQVVLAGRRTNNTMPRWIVEQLILEMVRKGKSIIGANVLVMGVSFKEDCPDIRNSKVIELIKILLDYSFKVEIIDPNVNKEDALKIYNLKIEDKIPYEKKFSAVIPAVGHKEYKSMNIENWTSIIDNNGVIFDLKGIVPIELKPVRP